MGESCGRVSLWESQTGFRAGLLSTNQTDLQHYHYHGFTVSSYGDNFPQGLRNNHSTPFSEEALTVGGIPKGRVESTAHTSAVSRIIHNRVRNFQGAEDGSSYSFHNVLSQPVFRVHYDTASCLLAGVTSAGVVLWGP